MKFKTFVETKDNGKSYLIISKFLAPLTGKEYSWEIELPDYVEPLVFYTATTGMIETIGNMASDDTATGYAFHTAHHVFKVNNLFNYKKNERVYITEHLRLNGTPEYFVTKHRVMQGQHNFINVGYILNDKRVTKLLIDVVTGEHKWL